MFDLPEILPELLPCPFCGHHAMSHEKVHGEYWGQWDWELRCSSSHCCARIRIVADTWEEPRTVLQPDGSYLPTKITRLTNLYKMWNRRVVDKSN
jgi:hypothetical protein